MNHEQHDVSFGFSLVNLYHKFTIFHLLHDFDGRKAIQLTTHVDIR